MAPSHPRTHNRLLAHRSRREPLEGPRTTESSKLPAIAHWVFALRDTEFACVGRLVNSVDHLRENRGYVGHRGGQLLQTFYGCERRPGGTAATSLLNSLARS